MNSKNNLLKESEKSKLGNVLKMNFRRYLPGFLVALGGCLIVSVVAAFIEYGFALSDVKIPNIVCKIRRNGCVSKLFYGNLFPGAAL